jgi:hypothetical protein
VTTVRVGGNNTERLGDWLVLHRLVRRRPSCFSDVDDEDGEVVEAFGMKAHAQHRYPPRDPADKRRPQLERDMVVLLAAQQRERDDDHATRCTLLRLLQIFSDTEDGSARRPASAASTVERRVAEQEGSPRAICRTARALRADVQAAAGALAPAHYLAKTARVFCRATCCQHRWTARCSPRCGCTPGRRLGCLRLTWACLRWSLKA